MDSIGDAIRDATAYLTEHPDEARYSDSPATARVESGLRVVTTGPDGAEVATDMVAAVGGTASAPSPGWLLRAAEASCVATFIVMRAATLGHSITDLEVSVDSVSDDRGLLDIDTSVPAGPLSTAIRVRAVIGALGTDETEELIRWAVEHCPVVDAMRRPVPIDLFVQSS